ncbi:MULTISPECIES: alcohol dehydrogenase catalytic domain-containing protein [unclassified Mesorhizobium]|uniref:alcohol dehydrogenase catalytic domain-containing protein n=1 Tax=unclassified Mesorhizobium TaxID=325217 RepID=UPI001FDF50A3|nr:MULTISPECIES: alcohol dehydrogenase catalytic domain-containing protein [unclassified Mesorhizobium]
MLVRIANGGICGSDLHCYNHGGFGPVRVREPMILDHEISGHVAALGAGVVGVQLGAMVAVSPSSPCGPCGFCRSGQPIHCSDMCFLGSAMRTPLVQGGFADYIVCDAANAVAMAAGVDAAIGLLLLLSARLARAKWWSPTSSTSRSPSPLRSAPTIRSTSGGRAGCAGRL